MKHNLKITALLLSMFVATQLIGLYVISSNPFTTQQTQANGTVPNPYLEWINPPPAQTQADFNSSLVYLVFAFVLAILLLILLMRSQVTYLLKIWFFSVITIALLLSFMAIAKNLNLNISQQVIFFTALAISLILAFVKISGKSFLVHNLTELLIYPGIATVFVPILNVWTVVALLILISIYDMWAVWHSGVMQRMAKYQINTLKIFSGFFVPYVSKQQRSQIKSWKKTMSKSQLKKKKIKVNVAILGGGDVVFPIITAGVMFMTLGIVSALFVILGATLGLTYLFFAAEKKKFYPAMPFITAGILVGIIASYLIL
ncbi:MAG: presenilin family intramembrane aspartyl protease [Candidatus Pacearchaeota archaeon]|jgi:presenilin-like A22 family membrane protease